MADCGTNAPLNRSPRSRLDPGTICVNSIPSAIAILRYNDSQPSSQKSVPGDPRMNRRTFVSGSALAAGAIFRGGMPVAQAAAAKLSSGGNPVVETTGGKVRGVQSGKVFSFKGVHYGAPTTGKLRFMPPAKVAPWADVKDALDIGQRAPQLPGNLVPEYAVMERTEPMGGDCLCVNVFTTGIKDNRKRPVMVWLHGGGFSAGSGGGNVLYDGSNLALKHDVVVVTVSHRLNVFGYLY